MFEGIDMKAQRGKQKAFFTVLFKAEASGVQQYMRTAHARLVTEKGLADAHFDAVAGHLQASLEELNVPPTEVQTIMSAAAGLREDVLNR